MKKNVETELWLSLVHVHVYMDGWLVNNGSDKAAVKLQPQNCRNLRKNIALCAYWSMIVLQNWLLEFG